MFLSVSVRLSASVERFGVSHMQDFFDGLVLRSLKGALAVHFYLPLLSFNLYTTFKSGIAAAGEPIPSE